MNGRKWKALSAARMAEFGSLLLELSGRILLNFRQLQPEVFGFDDATLGFIDFFSEVAVVGCQAVRNRRLVRGASRCGASRLDHPQSAGDCADPADRSQSAVPPGGNDV